VTINLNSQAIMSVESKSWTSESLRDALRKGTAILKDNTDGKADCWKRFKLVETADGESIFGWAACSDCLCCMLFKSISSNGAVKLYGTKNMTDHTKSCFTNSGKQTSMINFVKRVPGKKFSESEKGAVKNAEVRLVAEAGLSFAVVDNSAFRSFAQLMIQIGSKHGNIDVDDVLYGRQTVRDSVFQKMQECKNEIKKQVAISAKHKAVSFCTDMTTDDVNKNPYSDFTVFWVNDWKLQHAMYKCEFFPEKHTAINLQKFVDDTLSELGLSLIDTPCTTDKGANIVAATATKTHVDCSCHRLNTSVDTAWKKILTMDAELRQLDSFCHDLVRYVNQASGIQSLLPTSLKHGGETRPWRSLSSMFSSISKSREALVPILRARKKEQLIARIDIDLLNEVVTFLDVFPSLFDILEYANIPTLQNSLPVYYTLYEAWQHKPSDSSSVRLMKTEFLAALTNKYWNSLNMLHFVATYLDPSLRAFAFVTKSADRQGFFKQVKDCLLSMAKETQTPSQQTAATSNSVTQVSLQSEVNPSSESSETLEASSSTLSMPMKKLKTGPFHWFQTASVNVSRLDIFFHNHIFYQCLTFCYLINY